MKDIFAGQGLLRPLAQQSGNILRRHRTSEEEALHIGAMPVAEKIELILAFHPFGDHLQAQAVGHAGDRFDDGGIFRVDGDIANEFLGDFQPVERESA